MDKIPERSVMVIEPSTTGKLSRASSQPGTRSTWSHPRRGSRPTKRDAERIVKEDILGYLRSWTNGDMSKVIDTERNNSLYLLEALAVATGLTSERREIID